MIFENCYDGLKSIFKDKLDIESLFNPKENQNDNIEYFFERNLPLDEELEKKEIKNMK